MTNKNEIEIIFDIEEKTYHAIWSPPLSIGAGNSELAALKDMKEALLFYLNTLIKSKHQKMQLENQEL
ncbi:MAG: hypothetical protein Q8R87_10840 [Anaerolineaceae bacterium]|jgi:predicted RNase H-like HicB family nuclease|nr:hypothetical protein [Anaerolineaceae bacterium]